MSANQDPLEQLASPDRVFYATGVLLAADDFQDEQTYHRGRLARALVSLHGSGTIAGLRVLWNKAVPAIPGPPPVPAREEQIEVEPGVALDRLGRLIELARPACIRLGRWLDDQSDDDLLQALYLGAEAPEVEGVRKEGIVADLFIRFAVCERGKTPSFASGPFDALDAVVPSRLRDGYRLELRVRKERPLPQPINPWPATRAQLHETIFDAWDRANARDARGELEPLQEHAAGQDPSFVFLARLVVPAAQPAPGGRVTRSAGVDATVINTIRPFVYSADALERLIGA